jgi:hypothetical protein
MPNANKHTNSPALVPRQSQQTEMLAKLQQMLAQLAAQQAAQQGSQQATQQATQPR